MQLIPSLPSLSAVVRICKGLFQSHCLFLQDGSLFGGDRGVLQVGYLWFAKNDCTKSAQNPFTGEKLPRKKTLQKNPQSLYS
jgi:hypothetical protein